MRYSVICKSVHPHSEIERVPCFLFIHIFPLELPVAPVVGSNQVKEYDDSSLIEKLDKLQKQYEDLKKQMVGCFITMINNSFMYNGPRGRDEGAKPKQDFLFEFLLWEIKVYDVMKVLTKLPST